jgi:hypothetical protein
MCYIEASFLIKFEWDVNGESTKKKKKKKNKKKKELKEEAEEERRSQRRRWNTRRGAGEIDEKEYSVSSFSDL